MKLFGKKKDKNKSAPDLQSKDLKGKSANDRDEVELACRDLMLASLENMRKEVIPGRRDTHVNDDLEKQYQEIADFINSKVDELEGGMPVMPASDEPDDTTESQDTPDVISLVDELDSTKPDSPNEKLVNMEPIEQEFSLSPNKQMIIDQITANDIDSAVSMKDI